MSKRYIVQKPKNAKTFELREDGADSYLAKIRDEDVARQIAYLLNLQEHGQQLVSLPDETFRMIGELMEHYFDKGASSINRADVIHASIQAIHQNVFENKAVRA